jgi:CheY-like chemotaxis protein
MLDACTVVDTWLNLVVVLAMVPRPAARSGLASRAFGHARAVLRSPDLNTTLNLTPCVFTSNSFWQIPEFGSARRLAVATLLYVDDNPQRLQVLPARLELQGYEVLSAHDGAEALEIFAKKQIDLAVVDYYMPGMGGDILALEMKQTKPHVPVIIFSGTFTLREMVIAFVDGFISTADGVEPLLGKIRELLPESRARRGRRIRQERKSSAA